MSISGKLRTVALAALLAAPATGCLVYARPPRPGVMYVAVAPPAPRVEVIPAAPAVGFVWITGYWAYRGAQYVWEPGRWERPAEGRTVWVAHKWVHDSHGWYLVEGHWR